ncbi:hypothetical protein GE061_017403 [Apolygus lucorum]|uniref:Uncharacterized protein n=1 Tax=Apolygus lucorum TaxID=248454 RepID=A0A8S9XB04_APOLU|nr:hypothetical protein GE061_017403 [Apolygus lucorum]
MALLGYQVVISLIMASVIQKIGKHYSFAKWMICNTGLVRYLYPTDSELRQLAGVPKEINKKKKDKRHHENGHISSSQVFHVPRNLNLELENAKVGILDVIHLRFFQDYQMLLDFALYSMIVYVLTEIFSYFMPLKDEINLSMVWCLLVILFSTYPLMNFGVTSPLMLW